MVRARSTVTGQGSVGKRRTPIRTFTLIQQVVDSPGPWVTAEWGDADRTPALVHRHRPHVRGAARPPRPGRREDRGVRAGSPGGRRRRATVAGVPAGRPGHEKPPPV